MRGHGAGFGVGGGVGIATNPCLAMVHGYGAEFGVGGDVGTDTVQLRVRSSGDTIECENVNKKVVSLVMHKGEIMFEWHVASITPCLESCPVQFAWFSIIDLVAPMAHHTAAEASGLHVDLDYSPYNL